jgi:TRAP-type C4-dicarboxylate transport system substrate-binding protein
MDKNKVVAYLVISIMVLAMGGVHSAFAAEKPIVIRLGHVGFTGSLFEKTSLYFEKIVEGRTNGAVDIRVYGASQLGNDQEMLQAVRLGNLEMCAPSTILPSTFPIFALQELPFLFKDRDHVEKVMTGRVGYKLNEILGKKGMMTLGFWENGFRKITNNVRPIRIPDDLKGIKLRVPKSPGGLLRSPARGYRWAREPVGPDCLGEVPRGSEIYVHLQPRVHTSLSAHEYEVLQRAPQGHPERVTISGP